MAFQIPFDVDPKNRPEQLFEDNDSHIVNDYMTRVANQQLYLGQETI